jgi:hypothetical protein
MYQQGPMMQPGAELVPSPSGEPVLVTIGDINVTASSVHTPSGTVPISDATWTVNDMTTTTQGIPTWAIVLAIVLFLACFLGLLFLLVKEEKTAGAVQVTVQSRGFVHTSQIPVYSKAQVADVFARVNHARTISAASQQQGQAGQPGQDSTII